MHVRVPPPISRARVGGDGHRHLSASGSHGSTGDRRTDDARAVAHDLRAHLNSIRLLAQVVQTRESVLPRSAKALDAIVELSDLLLQLCRVIVDGAPADGPVRVDELVETVAASWRPTAPCAVDTDVEPSTVLASELDLRRILDNLISNACRAAGPDGNVQIRVERWGDRVGIVVADSGPGFDNTDPGLGLQIVHELVRHHGGRFTINAIKPGGTAATVTLPAAVSGASDGQEAPR